MQDGQPSPPAGPLRRRWLAPVLLLLGAGLGLIWWELTAPPGLATVEPVAGPSGGVVLPVSAVRNLRPGLGHPGPPHVFVVQDGRVERRAVRLGSITADQVEIRAGLAVGETVAANPPHGLEDRHRVMPRPELSGFSAPAPRHPPAAPPR